MSKIIISGAATDESRISKIRKARSLNDLMAVINDIKSDFLKSRKIVDNLTASLSKDDEDEIRIDRTGTAPLTRSRIKVGPNKPSTQALGVKLDKFVVPDRKILANNTKVVQDLYANAQELDGVEALLRQTFSGAKNQKQALRAVVDLKREIDSTIFKALSVLNDLAKKHIPTEMRDLNEKLVSFVLDHVDPNTYSDLTEMVYVAPQDTNLLFSLYLCLHNLKDSSGYRYSEYYAVLTGVVDPKGYIRYFLNTLPDFKVPGSYQVGKEISSEREMLNRIKLLFSTNDILTEQEQRPLPISGDDLRSKKVSTIPGVAKAEVKDDSIVVTLNVVSPNRINKVVTEILPLLSRMVGLGPRSKSVFKWKSRKVGDKVVLTFILTPAGQSDETLALNVHKLDELKRALDLDDEDVREIKKALKGRL